jgi:hypothetical protein
MAIDDFRDLEVWQRSVDLAVDVYKVSSRFGKSPSPHRQDDHGTATITTP